MSSRYDGNSHSKVPRGPKWGRVLVISLLVVIAVVVAIGVVVHKVGNSVIDRMNYVDDADVEIVAESDLPAEALAEDETENPDAKKVSSEQLKNIQESMKSVDSVVEEADDSGTYTFIMVGVDRRDKSWNGNSDSMMLTTINYDKERVSIISLMRDTYVNIPNVGYAKLNNSYARGGGPLLCSTVSENFNVNLTNYAAVDFDNMIDIVDAIGGIDIEWTVEEIEVANGYMADMCNMLGLDEDHSLPLVAGTYHCDGIQTVAYARNRYVGNSDYKRTERQRYVIVQIINKIKEMDASTISSLVTEVLPLITTNIKSTQIWELVAKVPDIIGYKFVSDRVPYDGMYEVIDVNGQGMLVPEWEETIKQMHETMYGDGSISNNSDNDRENT